MRKLKITKEDFKKLYNDELINILEQCDWISCVDSNLICNTVSLVLTRINEEIDSKKLHELYLAEVKSLKIKNGEWGLIYGQSEIIEMIYDLIESKYI